MLRRDLAEHFDDARDRGRVFAHRRELHLALEQLGRGDELHPGHALRSISDTPWAHAQLVEGSARARHDLLAQAPDLAPDCGDACRRAVLGDDALEPRLELVRVGREVNAERREVVLARALGPVSQGAQQVLALLRSRGLRRRVLEVDEPEPVEQRQEPQRPHAAKGAHREHLAQRPRPVELLAHEPHRRLVSGEAAGGEPPNTPKHRPLVHGLLEVLREVFERHAREQCVHEPERDPHERRPLCERDR